MQLPEGMCLLGCVLLLSEYQRTVGAAELHKWARAALQRGAEIEMTYSQRVTHVLCETTRTAVAQQVRPRIVRPCA